MRITTALAIGVAVAAATPAMGATWVLVGHNNYGSVYEIDRDSVSREGSTVTFYLRVHYGPNAPNPANSPINGYVARRQANCADYGFQDLHTDYMHDQAVLKSAEVEERQIAKPDTIAASVVAKACGG